MQPGAMEATDQDVDAAKDDEGSFLEELTELCQFEAETWDRQ